MTGHPKKRILVLLETEGAALSRLSESLALAADDLARQGGLEVLGVLMAGPRGAPGLEAFAGLGLARVIVFRGPERPSTMEETAALVEAIDLAGPDIVLVGASQRGREIAPMAAARCQTGLTADCTSLGIDGGLLVQTRPAFGGDLIAEIVTPAARPQMATVRAGGPAARRTAGDLPALELRDAPRPPADLSVVRRGPVPADDGLEKADIVVVAGLGLGGPEGVARAQGLAGRLGAALGATRAVVDRGWLPPQSQIGLSGRCVAPRLLIALGVSGSVQFMAGAGGAKSIVAVNRDPRAPILGLARMGLVIDLEDLWPELDGPTGAGDQAILPGP